MGIGQWKAGEADNSRKKDSLEYYTWLARLAEKGKITSIFFADTYAVMDTYEGRGDASFRGGYAVAQLDPVVFVSAMAKVSKNVSFGITGVRVILQYVDSISFLNPLCHVTWC
jgi:alkanesulfonate monooxygenase SsuD/methylene tetrahydromethanopterin reductase-like flavin-dependent oxidoreductase (luciferase family)